MFGIYFIKDVLITERKKKRLQHLKLFSWFAVYRIQGGIPAWVHFSPGVCFYNPPSSVCIQTINSTFLSYFSNLRFCRFDLVFDFYFVFFQAHISSPNLELSNAALQALGFCTFNSNNTAELSGKQTTCEHKSLQQSSSFMFSLTFIEILTRFCL